MITTEQIARVFKIDYPTKDVYITQGWGENPDWYAQIGLPGHNGVDFRARDKTPVYAVCDGVVDMAYNGYPNNLTKGRYVKYFSEPFYCCGKRMKLQFMYFHLLSTKLKKGQKIKRGDLVGLADNTGTFTTGSHLHFGVYPFWETANKVFTKNNNKWGGAINPEPLFGEPSMRCIKHKKYPHYYLVIDNKKIMIIDIETYKALGEPTVEIVNDLDVFADGGTFIWSNRIIN